MAERAAEPPLDEVQWKSPQAVSEMQGIHTNSVLHYFSHSPFFDPTSNNAILVSQFQHNPRMAYILATRQEMEARLKTMSGLEFIVAQEPAEMDPGTGTGVWVIRKQTRRKRPGSIEDEIIVHSSYFVVGENIYMAPTVGDILGNRMLSIFTSLNSFFTTASELPNFTPALGHTYISPSSGTRSAVATGGLSQTSKENTPLPETLTTRARAPMADTNHSAYLSSRLLEESIDISFKYGDEYMDENPIIGQPGEFHFKTTGRVNREKLAAPSTAAAKGPLQKPDLPVLSLETKPVAGGDVIKERKQSKGDKSPRTPGMAKLKRRKSKGAVSAGVNSPA